MVPNPAQQVVAWVRARARLMAIKAPKEAPLLLIVVFILGLIVLALFGLAWKFDAGAINL